MNKATNPNNSHNESSQLTPLPMPWQQCKSKKQMGDFLVTRLHNDLKEKFIWWEQSQPGILQLSELEFACLFASFVEIEVDNGLLTTAIELEESAYHLLDMMSENDDLPEIQRRRISDRIKTCLRVAKQFRWIADKIPVFDKH